MLYLRVRDFGLGKQQKNHCCNKIAPKESDEKSLGCELKEAGFKTVPFHFRAYSFSRWFLKGDVNI